MKIPEHETVESHPHTCLLSLRNFTQNDFINSTGDGQIAFFVAAASFLCVLGTCVNWRAAKECLDAQHADPTAGIDFVRLSRAPPRAITGTTSSMQAGR